jgi:hemerythrin-like domain-containing protein
MTNALSRSNGTPRRFPTLQSIETIYEEHRVLRDVLESFSAVLDRAAVEGTLDFALMREMVGWFESFADGVHQDKEELGVFSAVCDKAPRLSETVFHRLLQLHSEERQRLDALRGAIGRAMTGDRWSLDCLIAIGHEYVEFQRRHAAVEDNMMLPIAGVWLEADSDPAILQTFREIELAALGEAREDPHDFAARVRARALPPPAAPLPQLDERVVVEEDERPVARDVECLCF